MTLRSVRAALVATLVMTLLLTWAAVNAPPTRASDSPCPAASLFSGLSKLQHGLEHAASRADNRKVSRADLARELDSLTRQKRRLVNAEFANVEMAGVAANTVILGVDDIDRQLDRALEGKQHRSVLITDLVAAQQLTQKLADRFSGATDGQVMGAQLSAFAGVIGQTIETYRTADPYVAGVAGAAVGSLASAKYVALQPLGAAKTYGVSDVTLIHTIDSADRKIQGSKLTRGIASILLTSAAHSIRSLRKHLSNAGC
jgi:hypothetical protein